MRFRYNVGLPNIIVSPNVVLPNVILPNVLSPNDVLG
jgi:hypothetical protein